jgi:hypothetical protein
LFLYPSLRPSPSLDGRAERRETGYELETTGYLTGAEQQQEEQERLLPGPNSIKSRPIHDTTKQAANHGTYPPREDFNQDGYHDDVILGTSQGSKHTVNRHRKPRRKLCLGTFAILFSLLLLAAIFGRGWLGPLPPGLSKGHLDDPHVLVSNGTHSYRKTVLVISIDGLRYVLL